ncbi:hypothetical protein AgCh_022019 [Apium graveolens]
MSFNEFGTFLGAGDEYDPPVHTYEAYVFAELEKGENAEDNLELNGQSGPSAPAEDEIPLSELGVDVEEEDKDVGGYLSLVRWIGDFDRLKYEIALSILAGFDTFPKFVESDEHECGISDFYLEHDLSSVPELKRGFPSCCSRCGPVRPKDFGELFGPFAFDLGEPLFHAT